MNELYHYGVKGMKWGVRKDRRYTDKEISEYLKQLGNGLSPSAQHT